MNKTSVSEIECKNKSSYIEMSRSLIKEPRKDDPYMTLIIGYNIKDGFIIGADTCINYNDGRKDKIHKIIYDTQKKIAFACAGHSSVIYNAKSIKINDVINNALKHSQNYEELKELLFYDMNIFMPRDIDSHTEMIIARIENEEVLVEGYQFRAQRNSKEISINKYYDNRSCFQAKEIVILGCVEKEKVLNVFENHKLSGKDKIFQTIKYFVDDKDCSSIGGDIHLIILNKDGNLQTFVNGIEKESL